MQINLIPDASVSSAPAGFAAIVQAAADVYDQALPGNYTVNIAYGWGTYDNVANASLTSAFPTVFSIGGPASDLTVSYTTAKSWLHDSAAVDSLPNSAPAGASELFLTSSQEKALGVYAGNASAIDGSIGFNTADAISSTYFETAALVEIGHALGWSAGAEAQGQTGYVPSVLDLFRYGSAGVYQWVRGQPAYFSLDSGKTDLADFSTTFDPTLFTGAPSNEAFSLDDEKNVATGLTSLDIDIFNLLGFGLTSPADVVTETVPASLSATASLATNFSNGASAWLGAVVVDAGAGDDTFSTTVTSQTGLLTLPGAMGSGSNQMTVTGDLAEINGDLGDIVYLNQKAGADTIRIVTTDLANQSSADENVAVTVAPTTVATFRAHAAELDLAPDGFAITDTAIDVDSDLDQISADNDVSAITLTDAGRPLLILTVAQALNDARALGEITNANHAVEIIDTAADLAALTSAQISVLAAESVTELTASDASVRYTLAQTAAIQTAGLQLSAPANDFTRESFADGSSILSFFSASDALSRTVTNLADGAFDDYFHGVPGTLLGTAYSDYDVAFSVSGAATSRTYYDASGSEVAQLTFTANGGYDLSIGGMLARQKTVQSTGAFEVAYNDIPGQSADSLRNDFLAPGDRVAQSIDYSASVGGLNLYGAGLGISQASGTLGPAGATDDFTYVSRATEIYAFATGASDDTLTFAPGFGVATVKGLEGSGGVGDIVDVASLFANYGDARAAMTSSNGNTFLTDGANDTLEWVGVSTASLTSAKLGFGG